MRALVYERFFKDGLVDRGDTYGGQKLQPYSGSEKKRNEDRSFENLISGGGTFRRFLANLLRGVQGAWIQDFF